MKKETVIENRKAYHDYTILHSLECGIALKGHEVKSIRAGMCSLKEAWCQIQNNQIILTGAHITKYDKAMDFDIEEKRDHILLANKSEIRKLAGDVKEKGITLIPLKMYFKNGRCKMLIGVCKGKHTYDKRQAIKEKDITREMNRVRNIAFSY